MASRKRRKKKKKLLIGYRGVAAIVASLILVVCLPYIGRHNREKGASLPPDTASLLRSGETFTFAIDISHYQGRIVWDSLKVMTDARGRTVRDVSRARSIRSVEQVWIKATEGETLVDRKFAQNWEAAGAARISRGAYHFFRSSKDPLRQAENFISTVGPLSARDLPPVLDIETIHKGCSPAGLTSSALQWLRAVEARYGRKPIVYAPESFVRDILGPEITEHYPIWVAHYETERPLWGNWQLWQFTDRAVVYGMEGRVDLSLSRR